MMALRNSSLSLALLILTAPYALHSRERVQDQSGLMRVEVDPLWQPAEWSVKIETLAKMTRGFATARTALYVNASCKSASPSGRLKECDAIGGSPRKRISQRQLTMFINRLRLAKHQIALLNKPDVEVFVLMRIADAYGTGKDEKGCHPIFCWPIPPPPPPPAVPTP